MKSSGHSELDSTTCRLIEQRFRYEPARDSEGRPVPQVVGWAQRWWQEGAGRIAEAGQD
jgi:protein TonB